MLKPQMQQSKSARTLLPLATCLAGHEYRSISIRPTTNIETRFQIKVKGVRRRSAFRGNIRALAAKNPETVDDVTAVVTAKPIHVVMYHNDPFSGLPMDEPSDALVLELVSSEADPSTGEEKRIKGYAEKVTERQFEGEVDYECIFKVPRTFGNVGAVTVKNEYEKETFILTITLEGHTTGSMTFNCNSWVCSHFKNPEPRIFFSNKPYLPWQTPSGLKRLREKDLESFRGHGTQERQVYDRIYDYDLYNDLGDPDKSHELSRPTLGGSLRPYPRRCRTGRGPTKKERHAEKRSNDIYVPRDEAFSFTKWFHFNVSTVKEMFRAFVPRLVNSISNPEPEFSRFTAIDELFYGGLPITDSKDDLSPLVEFMELKEKKLHFETPELIKRDRFSWLTDEEFSRQTLAGLNPCSIQLVTEWPLKSKLDPKIYGPPESKITKELLEREINGTMTVEESIEQKRLFMLDYHDLLLPYVNKVREIKDSTLYASRTIFFLKDNGTLRPLAIELTRPLSNDKPQWKKVFTPGSDSTTLWLWRLAKVHVVVHDSAYHQVIAHWLRTHCCTEPYIIAANRQLSAMHPIYILLHPHFRFTMEINALARGTLINAGGTIESCFSTGKYSMEISSAAYDQLWRFDMESLPADLIRRGLAVEDPKAEHGVRLAIKDYPFANDGLVLWDAIKEWVSNYVNHYYPKANLIINDIELQAWWSEVRNKGHADKKDEPWWPILNTQDNLIHVLTTIIWVSSGHHAAVNFGQYPYGGYFPNRPTIARTNMPNEDPVIEEEYKRFLNNPEDTLLKCFPSIVQATQVMAVMGVLSSHSPDEEYLSGNLHPSWCNDPVIMAAFERFKGKLKDLENLIDERNADPKLRNRTGVGVVPYELLKPFSDSGVTGKGVPNSISI